MTLSYTLVTVSASGRTRCGVRASPAHPLAECRETTYGSDQARCLRCRVAASRLSLQSVSLSTFEKWILFIGRMHLQASTPDNKTYYPI